MATLKISDLSVGDWVKWNAEYGKPQIVRVTEIHWNCIVGEYKGIECAMRLSNIEPIPITAEILKQNGLFRHERDADNPKRIVFSNHFIMVITYTDDDWWRVLIYDEELPSRELFNGIIYSVHQLQHALRLAGVDKEINL